MIRQTNKLRYDWSTINLDEVNRRGSVPSRYVLSDHMGAMCFMDAPGFTTYFIRSVYTRTGNTAPIDWSINGRALPTADRFTERARTLLMEWLPDRSWDFYKYTWDLGVHLRHEYFKSLWIPLPYDHPRVQRWESAVYSYFRGTWADPSYPEDQVHVWLLEEHGIDIRKRWHVSNFPSGKPGNSGAENDPAYHMIREFYPEAKYKPELAESGGYGAGNWWTRLPYAPTPEECPGEDWKSHPVNGSRCQVCGWEGE